MRSIDLELFPRRQSKPLIDPLTAQVIEAKNLEAIRRQTLLAMSCDLCFGGQIVEGKCQECGKTFN